MRNRHARATQHTLGAVPRPWVQQLLRVMDEAVFVCSSQGTIASANAAAAQLTGTAEDALVGRALGELVVGAADVLADLDEGLPERVDALLVTPNGLEVPVEVTYSRIEGSDDALCIVRDASLQVHLERELRVAREAGLAAARERTMFLATMSHEIRTPLNGVIGMAGLLAGSGLRSDQREMVDAVSASGTALLDLVNDILDFTRIDSGQIELEEVAFDLAQTTEELVRAHASAAAAKNIDLVLDLDPALPSRLRGDSGRFRQALGNLVGNAIKFTEGGHVVVSVQILRADDVDISIECEVSDTGVGISAALREVLFRPFVQADVTMSRRHGGSGLGLAIARRLIRLMGGELELDSVPGQGSRFTFRMDLRRGRPTSVPTELHLGDARVLVVSALPSRRVALTRKLQAWGAKVTSCEPAKAATRITGAMRRQAPYELIIADEPRSDDASLQISRAAAEVAREPASTVVALVAPDQVPDAMTQARAGVAAVLPKPVQRLALASLVHLLMRPGAALDVYARDSSAIPRLDGEGVRVLVAEDNPINQKVAVGYLAAMGVPADAVGNGLEAVEAVRRFDYTLVLMDVHMPEIDGLSATVQIRRSEANGTRRLPIVGLTADVRAEARARTEAAGMDAFIPKPVTPHKLAEVLTRWIPAVGAEPRPETGPIVDAVTGDADAVLDIRALRRLRSLERAGTQPGLLDSLVGMFLDKTPARLERIARACAASQHGFVEIEAHSLKSSCRNLGAERMGTCAAMLERDAQAGVAEADAVDCLAREFETVATILRRVTFSPPG